MTDSTTLNNHPSYQDVVYQITMTLNYIRSSASASIVPQETLSTLVFMLDHCSSYISNSDSTKNISPSASPLNMVISYIDGPICQDISDSVRTNIRFMVSECRSTLLSLRSLNSMPPRPDSSSCCTTAGDKVVLQRAADKGGRAGSSCRSVPRSHHLENNRSNPDPPLIPADEGGRAGSSCRSVPRSNHLGVGDDFSGGTSNIESNQAKDNIVLQKAPPKSREKSHEDQNPLESCSKDESVIPSNRPLNSIYLRTRSSSGHSDEPSSDLSSKPPKAKQAKRASNASSKFSSQETKKKRKKKKASPSGQSLLLTLNDFYEYLDSNDVHAKLKAPWYQHRYLVCISPWKQQKEVPIQSTLCTTLNSSSSVSMLSTLSVSTSSHSYLNSSANSDSSLFSIGVIERNETVQMYRKLRLAKDDHFSCDKDALKELKSIPPPDSSSKNFIIIPRTQELYHSTGMTVINHVSSPDASLGLEGPLRQGKSLLSNIFNAAFPYFSMSASKSRNLPSISLGWTTTDCNSYKNNRSNIVGQIKPFLIRAGCENLSSKTKKRIAKLSCLVISQMSNYCSDGLFTYDTTTNFGKELKKLRQSFWDEYAKSLGMSQDSDAELLKHFRCNGNSLIINPYVHRHKDGQNDTFGQWDNTLSINARLPITEEMWCCSSFKRILNKLGYTKGVQDSISVSMMIYSRKCVGDYCQSMVKTKEVCRVLRNKGNPIIDVIMKGLNDVSSEANYRSLFDDPDCFKCLTDTASKLKDKERFQQPSRKIVRVHPPQYKGRLSERVAAYDKLVST